MGVVSCFRGHTGGWNHLWPTNVSRLILLKQNSLSNQTGLIAQKAFGAGVREKYPKKRIVIHPMCLQNVAQNL